MNGFAPLLEGFLAFTLTMLALTSGVSAIVGALLHLRRRHSRGLRDMVRMLYLREIMPLLDGARAGAGEVSSRIPTARELIYDTGPVPHVREQLGDEPAAGATADEWNPDERDAIERTRRAEFIFEMTSMPLPGVVARLESSGRDHWLRKLESAERLPELPWYKLPLHVVALARYWITLRYSLAALTDDEFRERLASSDLGRQLQANEAWTRRGLAGWDDLAAHLLKKFQTIGAASSETFARHSRSWSVAVGFLLAFLLNVDSLDLLNSYLTDPALRQQVLERSADRAPDDAVPVADPSTADAPSGAGLKTVATQLSATAQTAARTIDTLAAAAGGESQRLAQEAKAELQKIVAQVEDVEEGVAALEGDIDEAERRIRGVTQSLAASFPIGWKRFPNCAAASPDVRCHHEGAPRNRAAAATWSEWPSMLARARAADPEGFGQWLVGVLLTGLLLGLGTPFWVQAVNTAFSLRRWDPKRQAATEGAGRTETPAAAGATGGRTSAALNR